jgi:transcriptional regulator with XRE-family HTH domain
MGFPEHLAELRRSRGLTQAALAERIGVRSNQLSLYESGKSEPSLGVLRELAVALSVTCDDLVFGGEDRLSKYPELQLAFEATVLLEPNEQDTVRQLLDAFLAAHQSRRGGEGPRNRKAKRK